MEEIFSIERKKVGMKKEGRDGKENKRNATYLEEGRNVFSVEGKREGINEGERQVIMEYIKEA